MGKLTQIHDWMAGESAYKNGVTNKEVLDKFGEDFKDSWEKLKRNKRCLFYEKGRWYRWVGNNR